MKHIYVDIELLNDAIFTARNATVGAPVSLDVLPGATLLGAAAARGYEGWSHAFRAFQLGAVSFGDGAPLVEVDGMQHVAVPKPLSWHKRKLRKDPDAPKAKQNVLDLSQAVRPEGQWDQQRDGFLVRTTSGACHELDLGRNASMRTAMDEDGRARDGFLYGFQAVPRGTRYRAVICGEEEALVERAVGLLAEAAFRVGRSRNAEFGLAKLIGQGPVAPSTPRPHHRGLVRILLTSDLALFDDTSGTPRLVPIGADFGLENTPLDLAHSFLRVRRYSPYHGTRQRFDAERQVLKAGSVLTFQAAGADLARVQDLCLRGVGAYTGAGLGRGLVEPDILRDEQPHLVEEKLRPFAESGGPDVAPPDRGVLAWMGRTKDDQDAELTDWNFAHKAAATWGAKGIPKSQWGRVRAIAAAHSDKVAMYKELERQLDGLTADIWGKHRATFLSWCQGATPRQVALLARLVPREMAKKDAAAQEERP